MSTRNTVASRVTLAGVTKGRIAMPIRVLAYGLPGVGKSTFAADAPSPIFLCSENGTTHLDVSRLPEPASWDEAMQGLELLEHEQHDYKSVVVDTVNWLEPLAWRKITGGKCSIEEYQKGYGKGYVAALDLWRQFKAQIERLWSKRRMHIVLLGHAHVKVFNDPLGAPYDRYEIAMHGKAAGLLKEWCDFVLFAREESFSRVDERGRNRGMSTGVRVVHTQWNAAYDAKCRATMPPEIPLAWSDFFDAVQANSPERLRAQIESDLAAIGDEAYATQVHDYIAKPGARLDVVANKVAARLAEKNKESES